MKKILSFILTVVLILNLSLPVFAAGDDSEYDDYPVIIVRGISVSLTYEDGSSPLNINTGKIMGMLLECIITHFALKDEDALYNTFVEITEDILGPYACDKEGNSINPIGKEQYSKALSEYENFPYYNATEGGLTKSAVDRYGAENVYLFNYDFRKSPEQLGNELNTLIETAKADHNTDKVKIICASMGCMVTNAYFYYCDGYDSVDSAIYLSGAHNGLVVCGDALNGNISFDKQIIKELVSGMVSDNIAIKLLMEVFDVLGAFDYLTEYLQNWVSDYFDKANDDVLRSCLGTMPGMWSFCPDEYFDAAYEKIFGEYEEEYPVCEIIKEVGVFNKQTETILAKAYSSGVKISFVSHYNQPSIPVYDNATLNSDSVIETVMTSNFATVAPYGETLSSEYLSSVSEENRKYISPDNVIDASTALYKDATWFIKNAEHVGCDYGTEMNDFVFVLLECSYQPTVYTVPGYRQFLVADSELNLYELS